MTANQLSRKSVQLNGLTTAYLDDGQGETIVALHGIPTSSLLFLQLMPLLSDYRLIAPDLLGQGQTEIPPTGPLGYSAYANHLRAFTNAIPPHHVHLLIHDLGGVLGLDWATENVERLVADGSFNDHHGQYPRWKVAACGQTRYSGSACCVGGCKSTLKAPSEIGLDLIDEWVKPRSRRCILRGTDHFAGHHLERIRSKLRRIQVPVLVWGDQDNIFPCSMRQAWCRPATSPNAYD
jgi:haloalkane dehalogenase